jgi:hypothetical protein
MSLLVRSSLSLLICALLVETTALGQAPSTKNQDQTPKVDEPFRPEAGKFPPLDMAHSYRGELVFVDHANRRGSIRVQGAGMYFRNAPHPFAMLPYGVVRYHGAPADLRDIPLGTVVRVRAFLPPDPKISAVPVLPVNNRDKNLGYSGAGTAPAENHLLLLEDEPSYCLREGMTWKLKELDIQNNAGMIIASLEPKAAVAGKSTDGKAAAEKAEEEKLTFDAATTVWRGRERLSIADLVAEGLWPASGKKSLDGQAVLLGITWKPTPDGIFTRFHISDIWLDDISTERSAQLQTETHKAFIRSRWMPAWIDAVEYGKFGRATVTATLFGGMDSSLYADFQKGGQVTVNASENNLKHLGGDYGPAHMASRGSVLDVTKASGDIPIGSSGIQIRFETDLIIEGIRPKRIVRIHAGSWPRVQVPKEEYLGDGTSGEGRFPTPAIFPKY